MNAVMSPTKTFNFSGGYTFVTSVKASLQDNAKGTSSSHFDPGKMAVMAWSSSATHPSNCTRLWCSKYPQSTHKICLSGRIEMRRPGPHTAKEHVSDHLSCVATASSSGCVGRATGSGTEELRASPALSASSGFVVALCLAIPGVSELPPAGHYGCNIGTWMCSFLFVKKAKLHQRTLATIGFCRGTLPARSLWKITASLEIVAFRGSTLSSENKLRLHITAGACNSVNFGQQTARSSWVSTKIKAAC